MDSHSLDWPQSAMSLLSLAKKESVDSGELVKLILGGTRRVDSWLIENRILPVLQAKHVRMIHFIFTPKEGEKRATSIVPLPDGGAFACSTSGRWSVLEKREALSAIQYIGLRYAPDNRWVRGFEALLQTPEQEPAAITPFEVATIWEEITGCRPQGFDDGIIDEMEALGLKLIGRVFNNQGRLGL